jgi:hypothetical protein
VAESYCTQCEDNPGKKGKRTRSGKRIEGGHGECTKCGKGACCEDSAKIREDGCEVRAIAPIPVKKDTRLVKERLEQKEEGEIDDNGVNAIIGI